MGEKSIQKKNLILDRAREVFMEKGYKRVTMKDIVEACEISRGGLYLYFENTSQIFLEVLKAEAAEADDVFSKEVKEDATAADIVMLFLLEQKKEILASAADLTQATYEFYFENKPAKKDNVLRNQFDSAARILERLIDMGVETEVFVCDNPKQAAINIMLVLEGMKISAQTIGITADTINAQIVYIMESLGVEIVE